MKMGSGKRILTVSVVLVLLSFTATHSDVLTRTLAFEVECLDVETGTVVTSCRDPFANDEGLGEEAWDVLMAYHADRAVHAVVWQNPANGTEIALLEDIPFERVTVDHVADASFVRDLVDQPLDTTRVVLIRTGTGAIYKLGNSLESETGVAFDIELLSPAE
jgi:hypothetical protein